MVSTDPDRSLVSRKEIFLAAQIRDPEAVNHIMRRELDHHRLADGNVNLVGGADDVVWNWIFVRNFPPPLMPGDVDRHHRCVWHAADDARDREVVEEKEKENRYDDQHGELDGAVRSVFSCWGVRIIPGVAPIAYDDEERSDDDDVDDDRHGHHEIKELAGRRCLGTGGIEDRLPVVARAGNRDAYQRSRDRAP